MRPIIELFLALKDRLVLHSIHKIALSLRTIIITHEMADKEKNNDNETIPYFINFYVFYHLKILSSLEEFSFNALFGSKTAAEEVTGEIIMEQ